MKEGRIKEGRNRGGSREEGIGRGRKKGMPLKDEGKKERKI